jgi:CBS domain-containing protein
MALVRDILVTDVPSVTVADSVEHGRLVGVVTRVDVLAALTSADED